jgi:RimJ/RimL family protein N-acetyltransferase
MRCGRDFLTPTLVGMSEFWPLRDLRVRTPDLELRLPDEADLDALAALAAEGFHEPDYMPFTTPWTDAEPQVRGRSILQWYWRNSGLLGPDSWSLNFVAVVDGAVAGTQGIGGDHFRARREAGTGSWLGRAYQGRGIGTEMRAAVVHLAFAGLRAEHVTSGAFEDNHSSLAVSRKLGYAEDGISRDLRRGAVVTTVRLRLPRAAWAQRRRGDIEIIGLAPCLPLLGLAD